MASFLGDIFDSVTNQQATPQQTIIPTGDLLSQAQALQTAQVPGLLNYNRALAPGLTDIQLGVQNQIYGPAANQLQKGAYQSILDQLNLGSQLPQDLQDQVIQNALQGSSASGFGVSPGGRGLVAKDLGLTSLDLLNRRQAAALGAVNALPTSHYSYNPSGGVDVGTIASAIQGEQAAKDQYANLTEDIRRQNFSSLINTGGRILGTAAGAYFGGALGAQMGGKIGGSLLGGSRVAGQQQPSSTGGIFGGGSTGLMSFFGGGGGGGAGGAGDYGAGYGSAMGGYA